MVDEFATIPKKLPLLALILKGEGLVSEDHLQRALRVWNARRMEAKRIPFGQVILSLGLLSLEKMAPCISLQRKLAKPPGGAKPLGLLILENGLAKPSQLLLALEAQAAHGQRLGELLVAQGLIKKPQVDALLFFQKRQAIA